MKKDIPCVIGWTVSPQNFVHWSHNLTSDYDPIWREGLLRGKQVKMRSLGCALIQYNWCLYKKRKFGHRYVQKKDDVKTQGKMAIKERPGTDPSLTPHRRNQPRQHVDLKVQSCRIVRKINPVV